MPQPTSEPRPEHRYKARPIGNAQTDAQTDARPDTTPEPATEPSTASQADPMTENRTTSDQPNVDSGAETAPPETTSPETSPPEPAPSSPKAKPKSKRRKPANKAKTKPEAKTNAPVARVRPEPQNQAEAIQRELDVIRDRVAELAHETHSDLARFAAEHQAAAAESLRERQASVARITKQVSGIADATEQLLRDHAEGRRIAKEETLAATRQRVSQLAEQTSTFLERVRATRLAAEQA
ncbi:MAG: hypothetical protein AAF995_03765, partial [Planctomycetota bacterium]